MDKFYAFVDSKQAYCIDHLRKVVEIPSVSTQAEHRADVFKVADYLEQWLLRLGGTVKREMFGKQELDGQTVDFPPVLLAQLGNDPAKKTVCIYGHYDVQPASKSDGWDTEPFKLVEKDGKLYGRGSTDDKGPILATLLGIEFLQNLSLPIPVNLKFIFEGMEESDSEGLEDLVKKEAKGFLSNVDYFCVSDNYWLGTKKPCVTYGTRGISCFTIEVSGPAKDMHSGLFGGAVHEPMTDLIHILSKLVDSQGKILIPHVADDVVPLTPAEQAFYDAMDFNVEEFSNVGPLIHESKQKILQHRWRYPSLTIHGIEGAFGSSGFKTVIPAKVIGKFSIRNVPDMDPAKIDKLAIDFVHELAQKLGTKNKVVCEALGGNSKAWVSDPNHENYKAARLAVAKVWNVEPDLTREGGSIPILRTFEVETGKNVVLIPMGQSDDGAHSQNEKIDSKNYINGVKVMITYLHELTLLGKK